MQLLLIEKSFLMEISMQAIQSQQGYNEAVNELISYGDCPVNELFQCEMEQLKAQIAEWEIKNPEAASVRLSQLVEA